MRSTRPTFGPLLKTGCVIAALATPRPAAVASAQMFAGTAQVAGQPADPGMHVDVVTFRSNTQYTPCAEAAVRVLDTGVPAPYAHANGYMARLDTSDDCQSPDNTFEFYLNGVWGGRWSGRFSPGLGIQYVNLNVPEVALKTDPAQGGVRLLWFYGTVTDQYNRPVPAGTSVTASQPGLPQCSATAKTSDLFWKPKSGGQIMGEKGFYVIGIPLHPCGDLPRIDFVLYAGSEQTFPSYRSVSTAPPYAKAIRADLKAP